MLLTLCAVLLVVIGWFVALEFLMPSLGFGAIVLVVVFGGVLSFGVGHVIAWLARG